MSKAVGYDFDKTYIKRTAYAPIKYSDIEFEQDFIRRSLVKIFLGVSSIQIKIITPSGTSEISSEEKLRQLLIQHYEGNKPIRVIIEEDKSREKV